MSKLLLLLLVACFVGGIKSEDDVEGRDQEFMKQPFITPRLSMRLRNHIRPIVVKRIQLSLGWPGKNRRLMAAEDSASAPTDDNFGQMIGPQRAEGDIDTYDDDNDNNNDNDNDFKVEGNDNVIIYENVNYNENVNENDNIRTPNKKQNDTKDEWPIEERPLGNFSAKSLLENSTVALV